MSDMNSVTANGTPEAAGQPLPASLGHFGRLAAAVAGDEQQQQHKTADSLPEKELPRGDSPEPLRVRSPASLKEPPPSAAAEQQRFSHEPWNWKLGEREQADDAAEAVASCDRQLLPSDVASCDQVEEEEAAGKREGDKLEHRGPQEQQNMSESLVA